MALALDDFHRALAGMAGAGSADHLLDTLHEAVRALGGGGTSLGLVEGQHIRQSARGFPAHVAERWARFSMSAALPGPEAVRTATPQFLEGWAATLQRFPAAAAITSETGYGAGACIPLLDPHRALGYVAVHYRGDHAFDPVERFLLTALGAVAVGSAWRVGVGAGAPHDGPVGQVAALRVEVEQLTTAMSSRAPIEQAKGMLMQRYGLSAEAAWQLLVRLSSVSNVKIRDLAERCAASGDVEGLVEPLAPGRTTRTPCDSAAHSHRGARTAADWDDGW